MKRLGSLARHAMRRSWISHNLNAFADRGPIRRPRLLVDVSVIMRHDAGTGIQRVVRSVWSQLAALQRSEFDVMPVHASRTHGYCFAPADFLSRSRVQSRKPVGVRPGDKFLGLDLAAHCLPEFADQLAAWRRHGATIHCVIYDLLPLARPDWFEDSTRQHFSRWLDTVVTHANQALCISDSVAHDFRRSIIGTAAHENLKLGRLHLSGDIATSLPSTGVCSEVAAALQRARLHPTILMIGTVEPRKAYDRAIAAFERLWERFGDPAPRLVIIGKAGWKTTSLQDRLRSHPERGRSLEWLENVSDEALTSFYEACRAVFLASFDEGFGLPTVEAATHRRWALVRDLPVFRQHRLPNLRYFDDDSPEKLGDELLALSKAAETGPPPIATPPAWNWCVERLLEEIGFASALRSPAAPILRAVS